RTRKGLVVCFPVPLLLLSVSGVLCYVENITEPIPGHDDGLELCFALAELAGSVGGASSVRVQLHLDIKYLYIKLNI
ncbi:MAG: hypothetical protein ACHQQP_08275, partial [Gemmatimonadales bacterium]